MAVHQRHGLLDGGIDLRVATACGMVGCYDNCISNHTATSTRRSICGCSTVVCINCGAAESPRDARAAACYMRTMTVAVTLADSFATIAEHWRPVVVATANGQDVRLVKTRGLFPWHRHADADEVFVCWRGLFRVEFRDRVVELRSGSWWSCPAASSTAPDPTRNARRRRPSSRRREPSSIRPATRCNLAKLPVS